MEGLCGDLRYYDLSPFALMSSSSCSRSPSPSPATPESMDGFDSALHRSDLSAWYTSLSPSQYSPGDETHNRNTGKPDASQILELEDLLHDGAFDRCSFSPFYWSLNRNMNKCASQREFDNAREECRVGYVKTVVATGVQFV